MYKRLLCSILLLISSLAYADSENFSAAQNVITGWFEAMKANQLDKAGAYLANNFISLHTDGIVRNKEQEMNLIKNLHMKSYELTDFQFQQDDANIMVATFKDTGKEVVDNLPLDAKPAGRMAILQKVKGQWLIIAYANLDTFR